MLNSYQLIERAQIEGHHKNHDLPFALCLPSGQYMGKYRAK